MMKSSERIVSAIVLNYLNWEQTIDAVEDLLAQRGVAVDIVVVDNASPNDSLEHLKRRFGRNRRVAILASSHNGGYARGNNLGARWRLAAAAEQNAGSLRDPASLQRVASGQKPAPLQDAPLQDAPLQAASLQDASLQDGSLHNAWPQSAAAAWRTPEWFLVVNNDVRLPDRRAVATLAAFAAAHPDAGMVGPRVETRAGFAQGPYRRPRPLICCLRYCLPIIPLAHRLWRRCWREQNSRPCFALIGACLLLPAAAFARAGLFDEATFLGAEEYILAERFGWQGLRSYYVPAATVVHDHGVSAIRRTGGERRYLAGGVASMAYYFRRYQNTPEPWIALFERVAAFYGRALLPLRQRLPL
jgi:GT2 family glycosyltransferase